MTKNPRIELKVLLDEDDSQTQKQLVEQLDVRKQAVSNRLREIGKIQKTDRWLPHELNNMKMKKYENTCDILLARYKRKSLQLQGMKSGFILRIPSK